MVHPRRRRHPRKERDDVKDRLIQTRVPERLENVLKEEAQKRRLSVSHLIRNMLEDTFELVDTVVNSAGGLAKDSAVIAEQVRQDAGKVAASVRGAAEDAGRLAAAVRGAAQGAGKMAANARDAIRARNEGAPRQDRVDSVSPESDPPPDSDSPEWREQGWDHPAVAAALGDLDHILAWNQVVANKAVTCHGCAKELPRGSVAHLGMSQDPKAPPAWLCPSCLAQL